MRKSKVNVAVIGKDGRSSAIERCLEESPRVSRPVLKFTEWKTQQARQNILQITQEQKSDFVIVGPEEPLAAGIVDELQQSGIPCVGPTKSLARLESSKAFTRALIAKYQIPGN